MRYLFIWFIHYSFVICLAYSMTRLHTCSCVLGRTTCTQFMDVVYCYRSRTYSVVSAYFAHNLEPCKNGWTNQDAIWGGVDSWENCTWYGPDPLKEGTLLRTWRWDFPARCRPVFRLADCWRREFCPSTGYRAATSPVAKLLWIFVKATISQS